MTITWRQPIAALSGVDTAWHCGDVSHTGSAIIVGNWIEPEGDLYYSTNYGVDFTEQYPSEYTIYGYKQAKLTGDGSQILTIACSNDFGTAIFYYDESWVNISSSYNYKTDPDEQWSTCAIDFSGTNILMGSIYDPDNLGTSPGLTLYDFSTYKRLEDYMFDEKPPAAYWWNSCAINGGKIIAATDRVGYPTDDGGYIVEGTYPYTSGCWTRTQFSNTDRYVDCTLNIDGTKKLICGKIDGVENEVYTKTGNNAWVRSESITGFDSFYNSVAITKISDTGIRYIVGGSDHAFPILWDNNVPQKLNPYGDANIYYWFVTSMDGVGHYILCGVYGGLLYLGINDVAETSAFMHGSICRGVGIGNTFYY